MPAALQWDGREDPSGADMFYFLRDHYFLANTESIPPASTTELSALWGIHGLYPAPWKVKQDPSPTAGCPGCSQLWL